MTSIADTLRRLRETAESETAWPHASLEALSDAGVLAWTIPAEYGGGECSNYELTAGYVELAEACLLTAFILTQRNGAVQRLVGSEHEAVRLTWLPDLCTNAAFATVGISHLTTSRQHWKRPAVTARVTADEVTLDGQIPWVTGASHADVIVTGGTCDDGTQVLVALPTDAAGIEILPHARLLALTGSHTGPVQLHEVRVPRETLIAGPVENVMSRGSGGGTGSLTTSALAVGHSAAAVAYLKDEATRRDDLKPIAAQFTAELNRLRTDLLNTAAPATPPLEAVSSTAPPLEAAPAAAPDSDGTASSANSARQPVSSAAPSPAGHTAESLRTRANSLVLRSTQAALAAAKGAGYVTGHPAERAVREALFFLVWSCPQPVLAAALQQFACTGADETPSFV